MVEESIPSVETTDHDEDHSDEHIDADDEKGLVLPRGVGDTEGSQPEVNAGVRREEKADETV